MKHIEWKAFIFCSMMAFYGNGLLAQEIEPNQYDSYIGDRSGAHYYYSDYDNYDNYYTSDPVEANVLDKPKYVSPQEFEDAIANYKKFGLDYKQRRRVNEHERKRLEEESGKAVSLKPSPDALLRLPVAVNWCEKIILPGFYLLSVNMKEGNNSIIFKQGNKTVAEIPVNDMSEQPKEIIKPFVVVEETESGNILLKLNTINSVFNLTLPVSTGQKFFEPGI